MSNSNFEPGTLVYLIKNANPADTAPLTGEIYEVKRHIELEGKVVVADQTFNSNGTADDGSIALVKACSRAYDSLKFLMPHVSWEKEPKAKAIEVNVGVLTLPEPLSEIPEKGTVVFYLSPSSKYGFSSQDWKDSRADLSRLTNGVCYRTRADAIRAAKVIFGITQQLI